MQLKLDLKEVVFTNDFFTVGLPDGNTLIMNVIDECILSYETETETETEIKGINIQIYTPDFEQSGTYTNGSNVIVVNSPLYKITTEHKEFEGMTLNSENIKYCVLEYGND